MDEKNIHKLYYTIDKISVNGTRTLDEMYLALFDVLNEFGIEKFTKKDKHGCGFNPTWSIACDILAREIATECIVYAIRKPTESKK